MPHHFARVTAQIYCVFHRIVNKNAPIGTPKIHVIVSRIVCVCPFRVCPGSPVFLNRSLQVVCRVVCVPGSPYRCAAARRLPVPTWLVRRVWGKG